MRDGDTDQATKCSVWQGLHDMHYDVKQSSPTRSVWTCICGFEEDSHEEGTGC